MNPLNAVSAVKEIAKLVEAYHNQDLYQKIVDLRGEILEMTEENLTLKERVRELEQQQKVISELVREGNYYYRNLDGKKLGPFCMACWDGDGKLVNVKLMEDGFTTSTVCGRCEH